MYSGKLLFSQLTNFVPRNVFNRIVAKYDADHRVQFFSSYKLLMVMIFGHLSNRESFTGIAVCIKAHKSKRYHMGFGLSVSLSNLSKACNSKDSRVYRDFAFKMMAKARSLIHDDFSEQEQKIYAIDSSTIDLCLNLFVWANFRSTKAGVKLHTVFDVVAGIPSFIYINDAVYHDITFLEQLTFEPGAFYVLDRAYLGFKQLFRIHQSKAYFVLRAKINTRFQRMYSNPTEVGGIVKFDQIGRFSSQKGLKEYQAKVRMIKYYDPELDRTFHFLTNNFDIPAIEVAQIYKQRWMIELFFKWIKSHLRVKKFWGRSRNALEIQIYTAITTYCLMAIIKREFKHPGSIYEMLQIFGPSLFDKTPVNELLKNISSKNTETRDDNSLQINMFESGC